MAQTFTDQELLDWLEINQPQIAAVIVRTGSFEGRSEETLINFREALLQKVQATAINWRNWEQASTSVIEKQHEKAKNYTNLISIAGYAGFFYVWEKVNPLMSEPFKLWTGLLLIISLGIFVFSEVF
ncbi:MAG: hypothetical protein ACE5E9_12875 [Nitrospinaceae bacterium]